MPLEALALERMNDRYIDNDCGCMDVLMQVWMAKLCRHLIPLKAGVNFEAARE